MTPTHGPFPTRLEQVRLALVALEAYVVQIRGTVAELLAELGGSPDGQSSVTIPALDVLEPPAAHS